jgi:hypothetical protein
MNVNDLIDERDNCKQTIYQLENQIRNLKNKIKFHEKIIFKQCNHEWVYDTACGPYDRIKYFCKHCSLWRNHYMYE